MTNSACRLPVPPHTALELVGLKSSMIPFRLMMFYLTVSLLSICKVSGLIPPVPTTIIVKAAPPISIVSISQPSRMNSSEQRQESPSSIKTISNNHPSSFLSIILSVANTEEDIATAQRQQPWENTVVQSLKLVDDEVVRVLDPNTVQLKRNGLVTFGALQTPSGYNSASFQDAQVNKASDGRFGELRSSIQTRWTDDDGGDPVLVEQENKRGATEPPKNPGDVRGCSDFTYYEDAYRYYDKYYPYYGDVARLDRDNDGIPCEGLPHTKTPEKYRLKKPR